MGNLNCCTSTPQQPEVQPMYSNSAQSGAITSNPDHKVRANQDDTQLYQEVEQIPFPDARKHQKTEFPDKSFTDHLVERVGTFQQPLIGLTQKITAILPFLVQIAEPTEQIVNLKEALLVLKDSLFNLNSYYLGIYEAHDLKETPQFLTFLGGQLQNLIVVFSQIRESINVEVKTSEQSYSFAFIQKLNEDQTLNNVQQVYEQVRKACEQFQHYVSARYLLQTGKNNLQIEALNNDLESAFPAYIRAHFRTIQGYQVWSELFASNLDICKVEFTKSYALKCGIKEEIISYILDQINSPYETISFLEFQHFVKYNAHFFDKFGVLLPQKIEEIEKLHADNKVVDHIPKEISDNVHEYSNGAKFEGKLVEGLRTGAGELSSHDYIYKGNFENGKPNGQGKQVKFGVLYNGSFINGLFEGQGKLQYPDGTIFEGYFKENKYHGQGSLSEYNGVTLKGIFEFGVLHNGAIEYPTGVVYQGAILRNRFRHGKGLLENQGQKVEEGEYTHDELSQGTLYSQGVTVYTGSLNQNGVSNGTFTYLDATYTGDFNTANLFRAQQGSLDYTNKATLTGTWYRDVPTIATKVFNTGRPENKYAGQWQNFQREGQGQFHYNSGAVYEGDVKNSQRQGRGNYTFQNGNKYIGDWNNNNQNGNGTFTFINGDVYIGQFLNGVFSGEGKYTYKDNSSYEGQWANDRWNGQGVYRNAKGEVKKEGNWVDDKLVAPVAVAVPVPAN